jgi:predicted phage terminase large subunit-like protein
MTSFLRISKDLSLSLDLLPTQSGSRGKMLTDSPSLPVSFPTKPFQFSEHSEGQTQAELKYQQYKTPIDLAQADDRRWQSPPHIQLINQRLLELAQRKIKRLIVEMPPRHGKSFMCSKYFPAWYLSQFPAHSVILASYESSQAVKWGRRVRDLILRFSTSLNVELRRDITAAGEWETTKEGGMFCTGVGGPMTGRGAHVLIIDDPVKNPEEAESFLYRERAWEWWQSTAYTRLEPDAIVIVIMTRWNSDDLVGRLRKEVLEESLQDDEQWTVLSLPALAETEDDEIGRQVGEPLWPDRFSADTLAARRSRMGAYWFSAMYQQRPVPREGALWKWAWIDAGRVADIPQLERIVIAVDPAGSTNKHSDSTGVSVVAKGTDQHYYVLKSFSYKLSPAAWAERAVMLYDGWRADRIIAESNFGGDMVESTLRQVRQDIPIKQVKASRGKVLRAEPIAAMYEQGRVHHVGRHVGLEDQLTTFPISNENDDELDAAVWGLTELLEASGEYDAGGFVGGY